MKKLSLIAAVVLLSLAAVNASATCSPSIYFTYWYYEAPSCYTTSGNVSAHTLSCPSEDGWSFGYAWLNTPATATASFPVQSGHVQNPNHWTIQSWFEVNSPDHTVYDHVEINVDVVHSNGTHSYYNMMLLWNGSQGSDNGCNARTSGYFTADVGDTINVTVSSVNPSGNATINIAAPFVISNS
ncbi:MAG TPA: hypothetical protein VHX14_23850 [Thermoanaerobaculia bacterium]|nr:hypothetical protein [Thermoanaerobaculia bacterium]